MYTELTRSDQQRQIRVWADQERCQSMFVRIFPQPRSRCVETGPALLVIALTGAEVRMLAWLQMSPPWSGLSLPAGNASR